MSGADIARTLVEALERAVAAEAGARAALVSASVSVLSDNPPARVETTITRRTKTLIFAHAQAASASGEAVAEASSVHRVKADAS